jgi:hypothetical protein
MCQFHSCVVVWLCGCVAVWLYGCVVVFYCCVCFRKRKEKRKIEVINESKQTPLISSLTYPVCKQLRVMMVRNERQRDREWVCNLYCEAIVISL